MAKKKIKETLSKREKEFLCDVREILKKDLKENQKSLKEYYEDGFSDFEQQISNMLKALQEDFQRELNNIFLLQEFEELSQMSGYIDIIQVAYGIKGIVKIKASSFMKDLNVTIMEILKEDINEIMLKLNQDSSSTRRSLNIFREELEVKKAKLSKTIINDCSEIMELYLKEIDLEINEVLRMMDKTIQEVNKHLKQIRIKDKDTISIEIRETKERKEVNICGHLVETKILGCFMNRVINDDLSKSSISEKARQLREMTSGYSVVKKSDIKFSDGRTLSWNGEEFNTNNSSITNKSYSYKELNNLAISLGYKLDRNKGDHAIYIQEGMENVVIPQKVLGKGLQLKILKDLKII